MPPLPRCGIATAANALYTRGRSVSTATSQPVSVSPKVTYRRAPSGLRFSAPRCTRKSKRRFGGTNEGPALALTALKRASSNRTGQPSMILPLPMSSAYACQRCFGSQLVTYRRPRVTSITGVLRTPVGT